MPPWCNHRLQYDSYCITIYTSLGVMPAESSPAGLKLIQDLVNTVDLEDGTEQLAVPEKLGDWLAEHGLADPGERFSHDDLARTVAVREALRALLLANNEGPLDPAAVATLNAAAP